MNPSYQLGKLERTARTRIARLRSVVSALALPVAPDSDRAMAWATIEALNVWASFLRAYYLSAATRARTSSGARITLTGASFVDIPSALRFAVQFFDPGFRRSTISRRDEPTWHDTRKFLRLVQGIGVSNISQVQAGLAYRTTFTSHLATIRNFYAHRCDETSRKAGNVGIRLGLASTPYLHATEILCSRLPMRPQNVATDWLDDIGNMIELMCL